MKIYLALAASFPPWFLVPNWPMGNRRLILFEQTKFYAITTIVPCKETSPWWYAECSATYPLSYATLISFLSFLLKHENNIFLYPALRPSHMFGIDRAQSAIEKRISSLLTKSLYVRILILWSTNVSAETVFNHSFL